MAYVSLIVRITIQTRTKVGHSDHLVERGLTKDQRIKGTLGITG
jgi:hypothetical protein